MKNTFHRFVQFEIEVVNNGYLMLVGDRTSGNIPERYVFNDLGSMNEFIFVLTGELE